MKRTAICLAMALLLTFTAAIPARAQDENGPESPDRGAGMGRAFGRGNGVRGTITAAAPGSFSIRTDEGDVYQVLYSANTHLMKDRQPIAATDLHVGDMLMAGGIVDPKAKTVGAVFVVGIDANQVREAKAAFGKTWTAGKVTAIQDLKITIERVDDKKTQVVAVDENTSFRKRREDVTLADVKVGDFVSAQGALQGDAFLAKTLRVMQRGEGGPGQRRPRDGEPATGPQ